MVRRCPRCNGKSVRYDRSLAGRAVCGGCGMVLLPNDPRQANQSTTPRIILLPNRLRTRNVFAWLIPAGLLAGYLYMWANPRAISTWMAPDSATARNSWNIATPADIELLIGKAQQAEPAASSHASDDAIRRVTSSLISKGVRILISDSVTPGAGGEWDPGRGELRIRPSTVWLGTPALAQAFAHEAAHVAQSCRAGGISKNSEPMGIQVDPAKTYQQQLDSALYKGPLSNKAIELEAYTVGAIPEWAPKLLDHFCK